VIFAGYVLIFGGMLALMVLEREKCKKWFESLDEEKKQNYLAHEDALRCVRRRMRSKRTFWGR
ncbi:MAG: hypothetical protein K2N74_00355, partial [Clostridiales bacterium]|nr:hypothetical protein [Clostridiales bacterium]